MTNSNSIIITMSFKMQVMLTTYYAQITWLILLLSSSLGIAFVAVSNIKPDAYHQRKMTDVPLPLKVRSQVCGVLLYKIC
jgi:hypothetical protein